jgi:hypothetical protein
LIYTAIQLPDGVDAVEPANLSTYNSPEGRNYLVRNPNFTPFYSIRFKSTTDSIANGESDVFDVHFFFACTITADVYQYHYTCGHPDFLSGTPSTPSIALLV